MRKTIILATAVLLTAGSIFALSGSGVEQPRAKSFMHQCPPDCCEDNRECTPHQCDQGRPQCCKN